LREFPTKTPRHSVFFRYKLMARHQAETASQQAEIARQQGEIALHRDEIARQQDEISRQHMETARLRMAIASSGEEINHLRTVIGEYRARLRWLIKAYKLYKAGLAAMRKTVTNGRRVEH
jgi:septal ring factor EnvC (AmiA/AmiB activator)